MEVTLGGDRLGAGKRQKVHLHNYERSTHDLSYLWRSTMACGTLVPFMTEVALPGDTFDIDLDCDVLTHPTIGPLFGTYKIQLDVFQIPIRLYQAQLHQNMLGIGMNMSAVKLPLLLLHARPFAVGVPIDNQQVNPSCIFSYLNIRGLGWNEDVPTDGVYREFNAIPYLAYWDIYKNYYANKQEGIGAVIHKNVNATPIDIIQIDILGGVPDPYSIPLSGTTFTPIQILPAAYILLQSAGGFTAENFDPYNLNFLVKTASEPEPFWVKGTQLFNNWIIEEPGSGNAYGQSPTAFAQSIISEIAAAEYLPLIPAVPDLTIPPVVTTFELDLIDNMREAILQHNTPATHFQIDQNSGAPYALPMEETGDDPIAQTYSQEGLALKTYQSDLFNNWLNTEWIDGTDGISEITAIDTSGGSFTIDELNLSRKIYDMLNRIAVSGGSYDDWLDAVYTHERNRSAENPMYIGGLMKNLVFQEVISNAATPEQPLGTLAGRGRIGNKHKGGKIIAKIDEPSYIMGIISISPNIDYSQGNKWDVNLQTMNDFHKPALDQIGFQDLITDQMAWWDTEIDITTPRPLPRFKSAGKQPAWINYMTNVNQVRGNFADQSQQMFMTLNRRYEYLREGVGITIKDLTTYIDPAKFNHIFADTQRDAQNFWTQISVGITARRKMSAKVMPNL